MSFEPSCSVRSPIAGTSFAREEGEVNDVVRGDGGGVQQGTPVLLFPTAAQRTPIREQKRTVSFADVMTELNSLVLDEEEEETGDGGESAAAVETRRRWNVDASESGEMISGVVATVPSVIRPSEYVRPAAVQSDYEVAAASEGDDGMATEYDDYIDMTRGTSSSSCEGNNYRARALEGGTSACCSLNARCLTPFGSVPLAGPARQFATTYTECGGSGGRDQWPCDRFGTIPARKAASSHGAIRRSSMSVRTVPTRDTAVSSPPPPMHLQRRSFLSSSLRYYNGPPQPSPFLRRSSSRAANDAAGGVEYRWCDFEPMPEPLSNSSSCLEDINKKMEHLMDSIGKQEKRIEKIHRLVEDGKPKRRANRKSETNTYRSLAEDAYFKEPATVESNEEGHDSKPPRTRKSKRSLLMSCVR